MYTRSQNVEGYSSTELSECESQSTSSNVSTPPPKSKKLLRPRKASKDTQFRSSRRKRREYTARQESARLRKIASRNYAESSSSESESTSPKATRGKKKGQVSRRNFTKHKRALDKRRYTKRANKKEILCPSPHVARDAFYEDLNIQQHQFLNVKKSSNFSDIETFQKGPYMPQFVTCRQQRQFLYQENPATSYVKGIDPNLLKLKFSGAETLDWTQPLPPDPILLSVGKPIWIPIWEIRDFQPCNTSHEESSDLALSDFEGEIDMATTSQRGSRTEKQGTKYSSSEKKEKHPYKKRQQSITDAKLTHRVAKIRPRRAYLTSRSIRTLPPIPEVPPHIPSLSHHALLHLQSLSQAQPQLPPQFQPQLQPITTTTTANNNNNLHRFRFLLLMHLYWEQNPTTGLTASLNLEYEGEEGAPWTVAQVEQMLEQAMADPRLEAYRRRWVDARVFKEIVVLDDKDDGEGGVGGVKVGKREVEE